jgi:hypothetical protein
VTKFFSRLLDPVACADVVTKQVRAVLADPLTQLALVFAALAMDVGHEGICNDQIDKEMPDFGMAYGHRAISEQHSIALIWELLMAPCFSNMQQILFPTREEFLFFRRVMVNAVMATDFTDAKMTFARTERWRQVFSPTAGSSDLVTHERATLIVECMAQTASLAYCLQHWPVYKKWSTRLFEEQYHAFLTYRSDRNPADSWFDDEIIRFDTVVVPLVQRLAQCGVFDKASVNEYLQCAQRNRNEFLLTGLPLVEEMVEVVHGGQLTEL